MTREEAIAVLSDRDNFLWWEMSKAERECYSEVFDMAISALSAEPCREADDYENEIADLHNRLDIAEYDKERYKEEITTLEAEIKEEKWIPVSERLPEDEQEVIVSYENEDGEFVTKGIFDNKYGFNFPNVKAWMPLPEPYKAEKGGE